MQGSLCHHAGVLYVGRHRSDAWIAAYDLDGRPLATHFRFQDEGGGRSAVGGLSMDGDHRLWVADTPARRLRAFTLFGQQVASVGDGDDQAPDLAGRIGAPVAVVARGADDELCVCVASGDVRRHALHRLWPDSGRFLSLRPEGDPRGRFRRLRALDVLDEATYALEGGADRVQVFHGAEHHYSLALPAARVGAARVRASALAVLPDGRLLVACEEPEGGLLLLGADGGLQQVLAHGGTDTGQLANPVALALVAEEAHLDGGPARVFCLDQDGERVQVFSLEGACYGAFPKLVS